MHKISMEDSWQSADSYEYYMGRWSRLVARSFLDWLSPCFGLRWLDVGCGSGALSETITNNYKPAELTAVDQSEEFVKMLQERLGSKADCRVGNAVALPLEDSSVDVTVSGLVLNFIPNPEKALAEMRRVTSKEGIVAVYVWDYAGKMDFLNYFWDAAVKLDSKALNLHEGKRFPGSYSKILKNLFENAGFKKTEIAPMEINTYFRDFDDFWKPFLGGQGPAPTYVQSLDESERNKLREALYDRLPIQTNGSIPLSTRAWAVKGQV